MSRPAARILVVDDEAAIRGLLQSILEEEGYAVTCAARGDEALQLLDRALYDLVLLDCNLPGVNGLGVLSAVRSLQPDAQAIMMTGYGSVDSAVEAMKLGAFDYVGKPFHVVALLGCIDRALRDRAQRRDAAQAPRRVGRGRSRIIGSSPPLERMFDLLERVAPTRSTVLISGETGTGKELVARAVHELSPRAERPFVPVNCSALPETLLEAELFGHRKGSFTGAVADRRGLVEDAHGGTLFLDEIATVTPPTQVKLLRVLQDRQVQRVGGGPSVPVDFRLVAACNVDLAAEVAAGRFREDLYYRLNVFPVTVPPLRHRREDVPLLARVFRDRFAAENEVDPPEIPPDVMDRLAAHDWPGNVRELENFIERAMILHAGARAIAFESPAAERDGGTAVLMQQGRSTGWSLDRLEREYVMSILDSEGGHQGRTAEILGIDRRTLYRKLRRWGAGAA